MNWLQRIWPEVKTTGNWWAQQSHLTRILVIIALIALIAGLLIAAGIITADEAEASSYIYISPGTCGLATWVYVWMHGDLHRGQRISYWNQRWKYKSWVQSSSGGWIYQGYTHCRPAQ